MLNKLLKRCMPWMDKGRWYHVRVDDDKITMDSIFDRVEVSNTPNNEYVRIYFKAGVYCDIIEAKCYITNRPPVPGADRFVYSTSNMNVECVNMTGKSSYINVAYFPPVNILDYWFFMRPFNGVI